MELRHLRYFEAVARLEHVSRAAVELAVAQPVVTRQIHELERELGSGPLFQRSGRNLRLTDTGRTLQGHVHTILKLVATMQEEMRAHGKAERGRVTIGAPPSVGERLLPKVLAAFHSEHPAIELRLHEGSTQTLLELLDRGDVDLAVVTLPVERPELQVVELFNEDLVLVVARNHWLARRGVVTFAELRNEPFLLYAPGGYVREATLNACKQAGFVPQVVLDGGSIEMLLRLAEAGLGVALLPPLALTGAEQLAVLQLRQPRLRRTMGLVSRRGQLGPATSALSAYVIEHLGR